jgi:hypothetical protein
VVKGERPGTARHIKEEENEMLPKARSDFESLADKIKRRKERLLADGVPPVGEDAMVKASRGKGNSPAQTAKRMAQRLERSPKGNEAACAELVVAPSVIHGLAIGPRGIIEGRSRQTGADMRKRPGRPAEMLRLQSAA